MPALFGPVPFAAWQLLVLAAVIVCAVSGSVYLARKHLASDGGLPDAVFWDAFAGLAVAVPAVIVAAAASPWAGLMIGLLGAGTAAAAYGWAPRILGRQEARRSARETREAYESAAARHRSALERWQRYELDPGYCIEYPAMSDPVRPETAALIRAMKAAEQLRDRSNAGYGPAVDRLERALADAELAAGAPAATGSAFSTPVTSRDSRHISAEGKQ